MAAILGAVDIAGASMAITALLIGMVGIGLLFLGYRWARKAMAS